MHGRINVAEGVKQLMGLDLMRDGECAGAATEAEWPAKHRQLPFTFKSHKNQCDRAIQPVAFIRNAFICPIFLHRVARCCEKLGIFVITIVVRGRAVI